MKRIPLSIQVLRALAIVIASLPSLALAAIVIDKTLTVNIYQVYNDDGVSACASDGSS
jgi:hypothetical protein